MVQPKVIGIYVVPRFDKDLGEEFLKLIEAAGYETVQFFRQTGQTRAKFLLGTGKVEEIGWELEQIQRDGITIAKMIIGNKITPTQKRNLEEEWKIEVIDKIHLVLEIFEQRAFTDEAQLQVQLAKSKYTLPYRKAAQLSRLGTTRKGHPNSMIGSGESSSRALEDSIKLNEKTIKRKLIGIRKIRAQQRKQRQRKNVTQISLVGYTCAGKSSFLNAVVEKQSALTDSSFFTTLGTLTRSFDLDDLIFAISDTVGFIEDLPTFLIQTFKSTLEELSFADFVCIVVDSSEPSEIERKINTCLGILDELEVDRDRLIIALNKDDLVLPTEREVIFRTVSDLYPKIPIIRTSALLGQMNEFFQFLSLKYPSKRIKVTIPTELQSLRSDIYELAWEVEERVIDNTESSNSYTFLELTFNTRSETKFRRRVNKEKLSSQISITILE